MKKAIVLLLITLLSLSPAAGAGAEGAAQTRIGLGYSVSFAYASSVYYTNVRELVLTGDQRTDIVNAALSQVGYHEGDSESQLGGSNQSGTRNYTEYGYWFGKYVLNNGGGFYYDWCAMFVSWCARVVGISESVINNATYAHAGSGGYYFHVPYYPRGSYSPKPGDLVFYDWADTDRQWDHVGILVFSDNGMLHVVEGNASDSVRIRVISRYSTEVQGFGAPSYAASSSSQFDLSVLPVPTRTLRQGMTGSDVKWLQTALLRIGYASPADGRFASNTARIVRQFQSSRGLSADGIVGPATRNAIVSAVGSGGFDPDDPASYPVPARVLRVGCKGDDVKWLQAALKRLGSSITIDGDFGNDTRNRVIGFQNSHGLTADGVVGAATRNALIAALAFGGTIPYPEPVRVLRRGMQGDDVKWLQTALTRLGFTAAVDGVFGSGTEEKVRAFQRSAGLDPDGVVGPATVRAIKARL